MFSFPSSSIPIVREKRNEYVQESVLADTRLNVGEIHIKLILRLRKDMPVFLVIDNTRGNMAQARRHSITHKMPLEPMRFSKLNI